MSSRGLLDTSVFIAAESQRRMTVDLLPDECFVSVITMAELEAGVLSASDTDTRARRLRTLQIAAVIEPLPVGPVAANHWARLRLRLFETGQRVKVNDLWIASVALANDLAVVTQDGDFDVLAELGGPEIVRV
jgi:predicted nucleic acid-binding protein